MELKIKTNFSFGKLERQMPKIIREYLSDYAKGTEEGSKNNIDKGLNPPLKKSTIEIRKTKDIAGSKPLKASGKLYNSIKSNKVGNKLFFLEYGQYHREGFTPKKIPVLKAHTPDKVIFVNNNKGIKVPARDFIGILDETRNKIAKIFRDKVVKALKK
tara:strand:+ start:1026 stop:1499 length:474 start_codon:yes stop_codon:yes gene_type:complete